MKSQDIADIGSNFSQSQSQLCLICLPCLDSKAYLVVQILIVGGAILSSPEKVDSSCCGRYGFSDQTDYLTGRGKPNKSFSDMG